MVPASPTRQKRPWFWFKQTSELLETPDNGVGVSDPKNKSTQRVKAKSDRLLGTKQQEVQPVNQAEEDSVLAIFDTENSRTLLS